MELREAHEQARTHPSLSALDRECELLQAPAALMSKGMDCKPGLWAKISPLLPQVTCCQGVLSQLQK